MPPHPTATGKFNMQVAKWGNSLVVRLPVALARQLGVSEGDELELVLALRKAGVAVATVERKPSKREMLQAMRTYRGPFCWATSLTVKKPTYAETSCAAPGQLRVYSTGFVL